MKRLTIPLFLLASILPHSARGLPVAGNACADANGDRGVDISDAVALIDWLFLSGKPPACPDPSVACGDVNGDGPVDLSDVDERVPAE